MSVSAPEDRVPEVQVAMNGETRPLDLDDRDLPNWVTDALPDRGEKLKRKTYDERMGALQRELVKMQAWQEASGARVVCLFEGRDAAGKGGNIKRVRENLNARRARVVALPKPTERERGEWYFQRYARHLPTTGEIVLFDRSWYNRAGVERVMGFAGEAQVEHFLEEAPRFEAMLVRDGIHLRKFWLNIAQATQIKRFHDRRHDPLKGWKLSPMDVAALGKWEDYTRARDAMFAATHTDHAPWTVVRADDKRRARLGLIASLLDGIDYVGKDQGALGAVDRSMVGGPEAAA